MPYTNIKQVLVAAVMYPAAIEAKLPAGAPKISEMLTNAANGIPVVPDFPMELPDLPPPPEMPGTPTPTAAGRRTSGGVREIVTEAPTVTHRTGQTRFLY